MVILWYIFAVLTESLLKTFNYVSVFIVFVWCLTSVVTVQFFVHFDINIQTLCCVCRRLSASLKFSTFVHEKDLFSQYDWLDRSINTISRQQLAMCLILLGILCMYIVSLLTWQNEFCPWDMKSDLLSSINVRHIKKNRMSSDVKWECPGVFQIAKV